MCFESQCETHTRDGYNMKQSAYTCRMRQSAYICVNSCHAHRYQCLFYGIFMSVCVSVDVWSGSQVSLSVRKPADERVFHFNARHTKEMGAC